MSNIRKQKEVQMDPESSLSEEEVTPSSTANIGPQQKELKISKPDTFDRSWNKLKQFITQLDIYILFNRLCYRNNTNKTLWAIMFLRGQAFW